MKWYHYCVSDLGFSSALPGYNSCHCQVLPSEYAYHRKSVYRFESPSANCRNYSPGDPDQSIHPEHYIHCDGTQFRLSDSDIGSEQYISSDYYLWTAGSRNSQLLFIFLTRVNLTNITLHYYSDSSRGLPRLRFWTVPYDFDIWDAPSSIYYYVEVAAVPPGGQSASRRDVSVGFNVTTTKLLMYKFSSTYSFAVSEVEFFNHTCKQATRMLHYYVTFVEQNLSLL